MDLRLRFVPWFRLAHIPGGSLSDGRRLRVEEGGLEMLGLKVLLLLLPPLLLRGPRGRKLVGVFWTTGLNLSK